MKQFTVFTWRTMRVATALAAGLTISTASAFAQTEAADKAGIEFFEKRIRPVLVAKCYECHSAEAETKEGGLLLDTRAGIRRGGDNAAAVVPGDPAKSLLLTALRYDDENLQMPPDGPLAAAVIDDFAKWIALGAPDPRDGGAATTGTIDLEEGRKHWAFQPIAQPPVPAVKDTAWPRSDMDRFVLAALEAKGLRPAADASPTELRRRIAFDLTGLPPESTAAVDAKSQIAALLASPQFGERWARHWLDAARYAESTGGSGNIPFPLAFRYRDWVIDSLNDDKPYDRFVREQLAGDLLPAADADERNDQTTGTGFLVVGLKNLAERDPKRFRMAMVDEQIDAVGRAFLGLTIACAKCHDHKFDPIPTADYYALAGIFLSSEPMLGLRRDRIPDSFATGLIPTAGGTSDYTDDDQRAFVTLSADGTKKSLAVRDEKLRILRERGLPQDRNNKLYDELDQEPSVAKLRRELEEHEAKLALVREKFVAAVPQSRMGVRETKACDCRIHIRGEDSQLGEEVPRGFPQVLIGADVKPVNRKQSGRLELAEWIASPRNPLTARVLVNRVWQHLFGVGLVETPDDFGKTGESPSHPALLDHLASRFIADGWSVKRLIAEIMNSRVYQMGTAHDAQAHEVDPANRLHWRMNRRRLDSDALFDAIRAVGGELAYDRPSPIYPGAPKDQRVKSMDLKAWFAPTENHRTIYQPLLRDRVPDAWSTFDFPVPELVTGRRGATTVPTQALFLMNGPFVVEQSTKTARRLLRDASDPKSLVVAAYERILNRSPDESERADAAQFLKQFKFAAEPERALAALCQTLLASAEFRFLY